MIVAVDVFLGQVDDGHGGDTGRSIATETASTQCQCGLGVYGSVDVFALHLGEHVPHPFAEPQQVAVAHQRIVLQDDST